MHLSVVTRYLSLSGLPENGSHVVRLSSRRHQLSWEETMKGTTLKDTSAFFAITILLTLLFALTASAQQGTSTVRGVVTDPQGNVVSGATVTLISGATNTSRTATTNESGAYSFDFVQVGDYRLEVEAKGFKKAIVTTVHALVAKPTPVDVQMEVGALTEQVTVSTSSTEALVNRDDATLGNNFVNRQVTELPVAGRNILPLLTLQPAVTRDGQV